MAQLYTGIDIGYDQLKVVSVRQGKKGLQLVGAGMASIRDYDRSDEQWPRQMAKQLKKVIKSNSIPVGQVVAGISGAGCMLRYLSMPVMPPARLEQAMGYEVEEQVASIGADADTIARDYRILQIPEFDPDMFPIMLALVQEEIATQRLKICTDGSKSKVLDADLAVTAAFNLFSGSPLCDPEEMSVLLDMGSHETQLTVQQGENLLLARTLPFGGAKFDEKIMKAYGVLPDRAEEIKLEHGHVIAGDDEDWYPDEVQKIHDAIRKEVSSFCQTIMGTLNYFSREFKIPAFRPQKIYYTGGGTNLGGLMREVTRRLRIESEPFDISQCVQIPEGELSELFRSSLGVRYTVAAGLAVSRCEGERVQLSLLPVAEKKRREFKNREVFVYYAAVLAFLLLVMLGVRSWKSLSVAQARNIGWEAKLKSARNEHEALKILLQENKRLYELGKDMGDRVHSGRDILACLQILRDNTPDNIFYTGCSSFYPGSGGTTDGGRSGRVSGDDTFQTERRFYLTGFLAGAKDEIDARSQLDKFVLKLQGLDAITLVTPIRVQLVKDQQDTLAERNKNRELGEEKEESQNTLLSGSLQELAELYVLKPENIEQVKEFKVPSGSALSFLILCEVGDMK